MVDFNNFESIQIGLASPETILKWSHGEVKKAETINYRTLKPEKDGLYCERIFGPTKDGECHCGKYKKNRYRGIVCDKCGVEVTSSKVRRTRMGHISLAAPVSHIWFFKGTPCRIGLILDMKPKDLEKVIYFASYVVLDPGQTGLEYKQILSEHEYQKAVKDYGQYGFNAQMGAEAIRKLLEDVDLEALRKELREEIDTIDAQERDKEKVSQTLQQKKASLLKRLEVVQAFIDSHNRPEWMILTVIPVIPPDLRPLVQLDGGRFATSDLNDLYRRVINRNNRLARLLELHAPSVIVRNEKRMLQEAVDALLDNGRRGRAITGASNRPLKSLSDMLRGKQGRFRQNLLGKRVDYSGRSVIVVGPELKIYQCGVPKEMAIELFKPFIIRKLCSQNKASNIKAARKMVDRVSPEVWDILEEIIKDHPVLLNRAPTLHRLGIQAFEPVLVEGHALKLHPLVCTAFNADFDGDQMAIHLPLSAEAQAEARILMLSANNLLAPKDGKPITVPTQDMVLGSYYLTLVKNKDYTNAPVFTSFDEAKLAYDLGEIDLHTAIRVRRSGEFQGEPITGIIDTTMGKLIFNQAIPQDLGFIDRTKRENALKLEIGTLVKKGTLGDIIDRCIKAHGLTVTAEVLDKIKAQGYKYSTKGAITVGVEDIIVPPEKQQLIEETDKIVDRISRDYRRGLITDDERHESVIRAWSEAIDKLTAILKANMGEFNPINMMSDSGARGNINQIKQLAGMRGLMSATAGRTIEIPIKANFREGLDVLEFFISSHGTRKTLSDTALRTADSGYLTRRLVDVSQEVIIREDDCGTKGYFEVSAIANTEAKDQPALVPLSARISGRFPAEDIIDPATGEVMADTDTLISDDLAEAIEKAGVTSVKVRSVMACESRLGVCSKCYGANLASHTRAAIGDAVGVIAAQSIGEPGTQLTMRTFHTGGVASADDITQGLPRVEELFEARKPKGAATISEIDGNVTITESGKKKEVRVDSPDGTESFSVTFPIGVTLKVNDGDTVKKGDMIVGGSINPQDIMRVLGEAGVQNYIIEEVQKVYNLQGVKINDRHIEVIVRQMMQKVRITDPGDTNLLAGSIVDKFDWIDANAKLDEGARKAVAETALLGITKAALATESFLSAASFQETTRVLTEASIKNKRDYLLGLKENVIIGKLIPAGTGMHRYKDLDIDVTTLDHVPAALLAKNQPEEEYYDYDSAEETPADTEQVEADPYSAPAPAVDDAGFGADEAEAAAPAEVNEDSAYLDGESADTDN